MKPGHSSKLAYFGHHQMELGAREAVGIAAQLVFCAMRHFPTAEAALNAFRDAMHEATTDAIRQAREGKPS